MAKPLVLKFDVDDKGSITLKKIRGNVKGLGHDLNTTTKHAKTNADSMVTLRNSVILLGAAYATLSVVKAVISDGIAYNKMMENQENGIQSKPIKSDSNKRYKVRINIERQKLLYEWLVLIITIPSMLYLQYWLIFSNYITPVVLKVRLNN